MNESPFNFCSNCGASRWAKISENAFQCLVCGHRHFVTPLPAAVALILDSHHRLLVIRRGHEPGYGKLGLPGGMIEPGETGEQAVARETREEIGITLPASAYRYFTASNSRYLFQGYEWPSLDLYFVAHVKNFEDLQIQSSEVLESLVFNLDEVPLADFAFESNASAIKLLAASLGSGAEDSL
jgi:NAD+ diphosphatase